MSVLLVHARGQACALPLGDVIETMRPLPIAPLAELPTYILGISVVRGRPTPVIDLGLLFGSTVSRPPTRFVTVHAGPRRVALAVDDVRGIEVIKIDRAEAAPGGGAALESLAMHDGSPLLVVRTARLLADVAGLRA